MEKDKQQHRQRVKRGFYFETAESILLVSSCGAFILITMSVCGLFLNDERAFTLK